jgi:hypothetical protein
MGEPGPAENVEVETKAPRRGRWGAIHIGDMVGVVLLASILAEGGATVAQGAQLADSGYSWIFIQEIAEWANTWSGLLILATLAATTLPRWILDQDGPYDVSRRGRALVGGVVLLGLLGSASATVGIISDVEIPAGTIVGDSVAALLLFACGAGLAIAEFVRWRVPRSAADAVDEEVPFPHE